MANTPYVRPELLQGLPDGMSDGNHTRKRHARYGQLHIAGQNGNPSQFVSGVQLMKFRETNGSHFEAEGGNDWNELVVGQRQWSVQCRRQMPRNGDLKEMIQYAFGIANGVPTLADVDFRDIPMVLLYDYNYVSATGNTTFEKADWTYADVWVTDYEWGYDSPNGLLYETFTCISRGVTFNGYGNNGQGGLSPTFDYSVPGALIGS